MDEDTIVARLAAVLRGQMPAEQATFTAQALVSAVRNIEAIAYQDGWSLAEHAVAERVSEVLDTLSRETGAYEAGYKGWAQQVIRQVRKALGGRQ